MSDFDSIPLLRDARGRRYTYLRLSVTDRWWGPGWDGSLILSNNARPIPAITPAEGA